MKKLTVLLFMFVIFITLNGDNYYYYYKKKKVFFNYTNTIDNENIQKSTLLSNYNDSSFITTNRINVKLKNINDLNKLIEYASSHNLCIEKQDTYMPLWYILSSPTNSFISTLNIANAIYETGIFDAAYPCFEGFDKNKISWDNDVDQQWALHNFTNDTIDINISSAWNIATGKGIDVAVIDSEIDSTHIDLKNNISNIKCNVCQINNCNIGDTDPYDSHGTAIAGIVAAERNNGEYIAGIAPDSKIIPITTCMSGEHLIYSINWAWRNGADIINCSWGRKSTHRDEKMEEALDSAIYRGRNGKGCIVVFCTGNSGNDSINYPGWYRNEMLTVGNLHSDGTRDATSNYGEYLDVIAPGNVYTLIYGGNAGNMYGTSFATPYVAGLAALILERNPDLTGQQVRDIIEQNTTKVGDIPYTTIESRPNGTWNEEYGYGLIDAYKALLATPRKQENY